VIRLVMLVRQFTEVMRTVLLVLWRWLLVWLVWRWLLAALAGDADGTAGMAVAAGVDGTAGMAFTAVAAGFSGC
jgi:hypothetical protein